MDFNRAEQEYQRLKALFDQGDLTAEAFETACNHDLEVRDRFGRIWQIGVNSGSWYCFENGSWVEKTPEEAVVPIASGETEMPEALQPPKKPLTIFDLDDARLSQAGSSEDSLAEPVTEAKGKPGGRPSPAEIRSSVSWVMLAGIILFLVVGLAGLGTLLAREQAFGWNPQTPVRFGSPTPTRPPTRTPSAPTATVELTRTVAPSDTPSPIPSQTFTAQPRYAPQVWSQAQAIYFTAPSAVSEDWLAALESAAAVTIFEDYNRLGGMKIQYPEEFVVFPSSPDLMEQGDHSAVQQEIVFAFSQPQSGASLILMCRTWDGEDGYGLRVSPSGWKLFKAAEGVETSLAEAATSLPLRQGNWATIRLGCLNDRLTVWDETGLIATVEDNSLSGGRVAVRFGQETPGTTGEVAVYFYRLLRLEE